MAKTVGLGLDNETLSFWTIFFGKLVRLGTEALAVQSSHNLLGWCLKGSGVKERSRLSQ